MLYYVDMKPEKVFITGASGCIGHYVVERLLNNAKYELILLVRDPKRLKFDPSKYANVRLVLGELETIGELKQVLSTVNHIIHIATAWGDSDLSTQVNLDKTREMLSCTTPEKLRKVIYFSTASILGKNNLAIEEAETYGTGYVRSKYRTYQFLKSSEWADKIITLFPTLVFGGDDTHPYSHISEGLLPNLHWGKWLRYIYMDASFHFLHAYDIAGVVAHVLTNEVKERDLVLGNPVMSGKKVIEEICKVFEIPMRFRIKISPLFIFGLTKLLRIKLAPWDRFCFQNPHFHYDTVTPSTWGLTTKFPTLESVLLDIKNRG